MTYKFDGPGVYTFRVNQCGCGACIPIIDNMAACSSYETFGESRVVKVNPPLGLEMSKWSPTEQFFAGFLYELFVQELGPLQALMESDCRNSLKEVGSFLTEAIADFENIFTSSDVMPEIRKTIKDLSNSFLAMGPALNTCGVAGMIKQAVVQEVLQFAETMVEGLNEVVMAVKMAIKGYNIYSDVSNAILGWELQNYFSSGLNSARVVNELLSVNAIVFAAQKAVPALSIEVLKQVDVKAATDGELKVTLSEARLLLDAPEVQGLRRVPGKGFEHCSLTQRGCMDPQKVLADYLESA